MKNIITRCPECHLEGFHIMLSDGTFFHGRLSICEKCNTLYVVGECIISIQEENES